MATTAFQTVELTTRRDSAKRTARPGFLTQLAGFFGSWGSPEEKRIAARLSGQRWCDATERQLSSTFADHSF